MDPFVQPQRAVVYVFQCLYISIIIIIIVKYFRIIMIIILNGFKNQCPASSLIIEMQSIGPVMTI